MDNISEVHGTFGAYDIIAKLASEKADSLGQTITWQIRKIANVRSTLTLMGIDGQN